MLQNILLENILFLDVETVPLYADYNQAPEQYKQLWERKASYIMKNETDTAESLYTRAGIYAEFGKIICISVGYLHSTEEQLSLRIKSFSGDDEKKILSDFAALLKFFEDKNKEIILCAHNGKEFDFPYISRRMLVNNLPLPTILQIAAKKPWEVQHLDTLDLWKFGDYKHYTSLELLAYIFNIPTPKSDIKGSDVARVYWKEKNLNRIVEYCQRDVITVAQLLLRFMGRPLINNEQIIIL